MEGAMAPFGGIASSRRVLRGTVLVALVGSPISGLAGTPPAARAAGGGNASVSLTKSVDTVTLTPELGLTLGVDRATALPGDILTCTAILSNAGTTLGLAGDVGAANMGDTTATVAAWSDVEYFSVAANDWRP
jgi:hypothetical protein